MAPSDSARRRADVNIKIDGKTTVTNNEGESIETRTGTMIRGFTVEKRLDAPDFFTIRYKMMFRSDIVLLDNFVEGKEVEIQVGYADDDPEVIMKGEIAYIEPVFSTGEDSFVDVSGYDKSHRLTRGMISKTWGDGIEASEEYETVASDIIGNASSQESDSGTSDSLAADETETPAFNLKYIPVVNLNPYAVLRNLGGKVDFKSDAKTTEDDKKIIFKKADPTKSPLVTVNRERVEGDGEIQVLGKHARFSLSTVRQYAKVEVRGWDPSTKQNIVGVAEAADPAPSEGTPGYKATGKALYGSDSAGKKYVVVDQPVHSQEEADAVAQAIFNKLSMQFITGEVEIKGEPKIDAGEVVQMKGYGTRFDGNYLITGVTHRMMGDDEDGFVTIMQVSRNWVNDPPAA